MDHHSRPLGWPLRHGHVNGRGRLYNHHVRRRRHIAVIIATESVATEPKRKNGRGDPIGRAGPGGKSRSRRRRTRGPVDVALHHAASALRESAMRHNPDETEPDDCVHDPRLLIKRWYSKLTAPLPVG